MLAYLHPVTAGLILALLGYVGSLGLRSRSDPRYAPQYLRRHARLAPYAYGLVLISWIAGFVSTWLLRPTLELGASAHLRIGAALAVALTGGWLTARRMDRATIRAIHPWLGALALLLAAAQVFFGLQLTP